MIFNVGAGGATDADKIKYGDSNVGATLDNLNESVDELNESLTNENAETFNFGFLNGVRGFFTNPSRADDSFIPFNSNKIAFEINVTDKTKTVFDIGFKPQILIFARSGNSGNSPLICVYDEKVSTTQCWYYVQGANPALRNLGDRIVSIDETGFTMDSVMVLYAYSYIAISGMDDNRKIPLIPTMTSNTAPSGYVASASSNAGEYYPYKAFDGNYSESSCWHSASEINGAWLQIKLPSAEKVRCIHLTNRNRNDSVHPIKDFILQGSNDGSIWDDLGTFTNTETEKNVTSTFDVNNSNKYLYYRVYVLSNHGSTAVVINELQLYK